MTGLAVTLPVYSGLLAASGREEESFAEVGWRSSIVDRLRPSEGRAALTGATGARVRYCLTYRQFAVMMAR
ncbi:hypothetical protein [Streptomyces cyaneus]|uniref:hypothetical protein n=1 Tax=Streptomyces cyaneus TaxID=1904 RepID=UPI000FF89336|nr:hypothetical protein [Streptomyces cyaneus]